MNRFKLSLFAVALVAFASSTAAAQSSTCDPTDPLPADYVLFGPSCDSTPPEDPDDAVWISAAFALGSAGERYSIDYFVFDDGTSRSVLNADLYNSRGYLLASVTVRESSASRSLTRMGTRSPEAVRAFGQILMDSDFYAPVSDCLARKCSKLKKGLLTAGCIVAAGICCAACPTCCPGCAAGGVACVGAVGGLCD